MVLWAESVKRESGSEKIGSVGTGVVWGECVFRFETVEGECEVSTVGRGLGLWRENVKRIEAVGGECKKGEWK